MRMAKQEGQFLQAPWDKVTLQSLARDAAAEAPGRIFLRDCPAREGWNGVEPRSLTFDAFFKAAGFLASQLHTLGVEQGHRVLLLLPNSVELAISILGCQLAGAIPAIAPVDEKVDTLRAMAERCEAAAILTTARIGEIAAGEKARQVAAKVMAIRSVGGFGFDLPDGIVSLEGWSEEDVMPAGPIERDPGETGLITFTRADGAVCAVLRTEAQMIAEALAIGSVLPIDAHRSLVSLMQPGAAASVIAGFVLPLLAQASVHLVGPYESPALAQVIAAEPTAHLLAPDHFSAQLRRDSLGPGMLESLAGILAITRSTGLASAILAPGPLSGALLVDFEERGLMPLPVWPKDGKLVMSARFGHPVAGVLPPGEALLVWDTEAGWSGFGAARVIRRGDNQTAGRAA
jgi:acyl-CoA synthetase (AMP-forming)/AMP-acid ligase II